MSFSFGANPIVADDGGVHAEPPKDAKDKLIEELQTKELLVNVQAPTVFNQIQVY
jgi:hypothetical protein